MFLPTQWESSTKALLSIGALHWERRTPLSRHSLRSRLAEFKLRNQSSRKASILMGTRAPLLSAAEPIGGRLCVSGGQSGSALLASGQSGSLCKRRRSWVLGWLFLLLPPPSFSSLLAVPSARCLLGGRRQSPSLAMPEFLEDPSVLTKEKLKSELIANNVSLPGGEQRKDVYVQLYLQHLTARNAPGAPPQPDFSSDEERETTPLAARNRAAGGGGGGGAAAAVGRKATKKTDKPRPDEKDDVDVTELSNEELKDQLMRYGVNAGPIVATTRKLYEKKLLKLKEQTQELRSLMPTPAVSSSAENNKQNGSNDSDQYSDNEEDPKIELKLEKREPLKGRAKVPVTVKQRRIAEHNQNYSHDGVTETFWRSGASKSGLLQAFSRESATVSRRATRKRVETAVLLPVHDAVMSESTPIAETVVASSNETLQVGNRVPGNVKHADPVLSISDFSKLPRRTPKKPLTTELMEKTPTEERRLERDILKEMFPYEASTPTGISASCRRPIKGAAGRPKELGDFRLEETYSSKYITKYGASADVKAEQPTVKKRSIPMWIKILLFVIVSVFLFLVYQSMETNQGNPFSQFLKRDTEATAD